MTCPCRTTGDLCPACENAAELANYEMDLIEASAQAADDEADREARW